MTIDVMHPEPPGKSKLWVGTIAMAVASIVMVACMVAGVFALLIAKDARRDVQVIRPQIVQGSALGRANAKRITQLERMLKNLQKRLAVVEDELGITAARVDRVSEAAARVRVRARGVPVGDSSSSGSVAPVKRVQPKPVPKPSPAPGQSVAVSPPSIVVIPPPSVPPVPLLPPLPIPVGVLPGVLACPLMVAGVCVGVTTTG